MELIKYQLIYIKSVEYYFNNFELKTNVDKEKKT